MIDDANVVYGGRGDGCCWKLGGDIDKGGIAVVDSCLVNDRKKRGLIVDIVAKNGRLGGRRRIVNWTNNVCSRFEQATKRNWTTG